MVPNWAKNILFLLVYMISGLILVIIIEGLISGSDLTPLNTVIESAVVHVRTPLLTTILVWLTNLGEPFMLCAAAVLIAGYLMIKGNTYDAVLFLTAMVVAVVSLTVLKNVFQITRPVSDAYNLGGWSFPSGHATVATAFFFLLAHTFFSQMKTPLTKTLLILGSTLAALVFCFSRLYLGAHWTLDILAGIALGFLSVSFTILMFNVFGERRRSLRKLINL